VGDVERMEAALRGIAGKRLTYLDSSAIGNADVIS
jgi:hypothetical protein